MLTVQSTVVTLCTVCFNIQELYIFRNTVYVCVSHSLTINSDCLLKNIKQQVFVMAIQCVYCEVGIKILKIFFTQT
jgi:hypothetical protein